MKIIKIKNVNQKKAVETAVKVLRAGGLIIYPTETCYGLGVDVTNEAAVKRLLEFKGHRGGKAVSIAVADKVMAKKYVVINQTAENLYANFLPGPLTVVSQSREKVVAALQAGKTNLGIRLPDYPLILDIVRRLGKPISATSANTSGKKPPYSLIDWQKYTSKKKQAMVDLFLDAGVLAKRQPSTVVDTLLNEPKVLRQGKIKISSKIAKSYVSNSAKQTQQLAHKIFVQYKDIVLSNQPLVFALQGELGAGKTQFAKGIAQALEIKTNVLSPTFVLVREYDFKQQKKLYHIDAWRMEQAEELWDLGFKTMLGNGNVVVIEWLEKVKPLLKKITEVKIVWVIIENLAPNKRKISYFS
ncbi:threonylcarbamoyl-AMP synthase [Patescibacteria group bacterium]|nr:threonylcarbamoyl-AMP synthase [Patescibacteria group bacterium]